MLRADSINIYIFWCILSFCCCCLQGGKKKWACHSPHNTFGVKGAKFDVVCMNWRTQTWREVFYYQPLAFITVLTSNKTVSMVQPLWDSLLCCNRWRRAFSLEGNLLQPMREPERESWCFKQTWFFIPAPSFFSPPLLLLYQPTSSQPTSCRASHLHCFFFLKKIHFPQSTSPHEESIEMNTPWLVKIEMVGKAAAKTRQQNI